MAVIFHIACNGCGAVISVDERYIGKSGRCLKCGKRMVIEPPKRDVSNRGEAANLQPLANVVIRGNKADMYRKSKSGEDSVANRSSPTEIMPVVRQASEAQKRFARDLGIKFEENVTNRELSALIDSALPTHRDLSPAEMVNQLEKDGLKSLVITWRKPEMEVDLAQTVLELIASDGMSPDDIHFVLAAVVSQFLAQEELTFPEYSRKYAERKKNMASHLH
jgi:hypothetical protein